MDRSGGLSQAALARMDDVLRGHVARGDVAGLVALVAHRDAVHVAALGVQDIASAAPMRRGTIFRIASMTKPVTAAAAMMLVEDGKLALDDPVERWLPELADRRVLHTIDGPLDDTVAAARPITLRDLLTFRLGLGAVMASPGRYPIQIAMNERGVAPGPAQVAMTPNEYMRRIGSLPLIHQPGERWMYHTGADILAVLIARASKQPLPDLLRTRVFAPLGMRDTGFSVPDTAIGRLATCYIRDGERLDVWDPARGGQYAQPPVFPNALVATADDYLAFARMLFRHGRHRDAPVLAPSAVAQMMTDHITTAQKAASPFVPGFWDTKGWGFGGAVMTRRDPTGANPGSYGWAGGFGTTFTVDPAADMVAILLIQRLMRGADDTALNEEFLTLAYQAIDA